MRLAFYLQQEEASSLPSSSSTSTIAVWCECSGQSLSGVGRPLSRSWQWLQMQSILNHMSCTAGTVKAPWDGWVPGEKRSCGDNAGEGSLRFLISNLGVRFLMLILMKQHAGRASKVPLVTAAGTHCQLLGSLLQACPALPCPALPCPALPCSASRCLPGFAETLNVHWRLNAGWVVRSFGKLQHTARQDGRAAG